MTHAAKAPDPAYHLILHADETSAAASALRVLVADMAHQPRIRQLAREVLTELAGTSDDSGTLTVSLTAEQMKVTHTAIKLLFDDLQREQAPLREILRGILNRLPDEHVMRAISLE